MGEWSISEVPLGAGLLGIGPVPGRWGGYEADLSALLHWEPSLVLTMISEAELERVGAGGLADDLAAAGVGWQHLPVTDFGAPDEATQTRWPEASAAAHMVLAHGGRVFAHCFGGCGRSGMALMRLMVEAGENADPALERLRAARPCAVETEGQRAWAAIPMFERHGWSS